MADRSAWSRASLTVLGTRLSTYPIKFIVVLIVAPLLGTAHFGIYVFLVTLGGIFTPIVRLGVGSGVRYHLSNKDFRPEQVGFTAGLIGIATGFLAAAVVGALWHFGLLGETGKEIPWEYMLPVLISIPLMNLSELLNRVLIGGDRFAAANGFVLINGIAPPLLLTGLVIIGGLGIQGAVLAVVFTGVIKWIYTSIAVIYLYRPAIRIDFRFIRLTFVYGIKAWFGAIAVQASLRLDQFLLGVFLPPGALGVYRIAVVITEILWMIPGSVGIVLFNRIAQMKTMVDRNRLVGQIHRILLVLGVLLAVSMAVVCWFLIPFVLGAEFAEARVIVILLIPGTLALVTSQILTKLFSAIGKPETSSIIEAVGAAAAILAYLVLIPTLGITGAGLGTSIAYIITSIAAIVAYRAAVRPLPVNLYGVKKEDITWARALIGDSLLVWRNQASRYLGRNRDSTSKD